MRKEIKDHCHRSVGRIQVILGASELGFWDVATTACKELCDIAKMLENEIQKNKEESCNGDDTATKPHDT